MATKTAAAVPNEIDLSRPFPWDEYLARTPYSEVMDHAESGSHYPPTMTSPDGRRLYLASQDIEIPVDDVDALRRYLDSLLVELAEEIGRFNWTCRRALQCEMDYLAVWGALYNLDALPDDYRFPEYYLEKAWRDRKPVIRHTRDLPLDAPAH